MVSSHTGFAAPKVLEGIERHRTKLGSLDRQAFLSVARGLNTPKKGMSTGLGSTLYLVSIGTDFALVIPCIEDLLNIGGTVRRYKFICAMLMSVFLTTVGCGGDENLSEIDVLANPALISRHTETITTELTVDPTDSSLPTSGEITSATLDGEAFEFAATEFLDAGSIKLTWTPPRGMRSGLKDLLLEIESDDGQFLLLAKIEVM
jgi:hypothetical protein